MNVYKRVYFRIHVPEYYNSSYGVGFNNSKDDEDFHNKSLNLFLNDGWMLKKEARNGSCHYVIKDKQELYLHPQSFSGVVIKDNIPHIEQLISEKFNLRKVDIYDDVFDITDEQYIKLLETKKLDIEKDLLEAYKTKRSNLYIVSNSPFENVLNKYRIKRLTHYIGVYSSSNVDWKFVAEIFENLVKQNKIIKAQTKKGIGYRTNKQLLKNQAAIINK